MTFEQFAENPPKKLKVYNIGLDKFHTLTLTEEKEEGEEYITSNLGNSSRVVRSYWNLEKAFKYAVDWKYKKPLYVDEIATRGFGVNLMR